MVKRMDDVIKYRLCYGILSFLGIAIGVILTHSYKGNSLLEGIGVYCFGIGFFLFIPFVLALIRTQEELDAIKLEEEKNG